ncbi:MAG: glycosyltransferase family 9 protein [Candidatus Magnetoovum sp. WYHC-5]|nr:glycosyltransferase family 9 protein [Candidatus Magnetoovum sp. WYHC-5]
MFNKIDLIKKLDRYVGKPLLPVLKAVYKPRQLNVEKPSSFLFIRPGGIGDAVLLLPIIIALKKLYPEALINVLCEKRNSAVFALIDGINEVFLYDRKIDLLQGVLGIQYDIVVDTEQWYRFSAIVAYLTGAPIRVGFSTNERRRLFTYPVSYSNDDYEINSFSNLLSVAINKPINIPLRECAYAPYTPFIKIDSKDNQFVSPIHSKGIICIFPGASVYQKKWSKTNYGLLAKKLSNDGYKIVILGAATESKDAKIIIGAAPDSIDLTKKTTIKDICNILSISSLLITPDSGLLHLAFAVGTKTVSIFGASSVTKWAPKGQSHTAICKELNCSPCSSFGNVPPCLYNCKCMSMISVDEVYEKSINLLENTNLE